VLIVALWNRVKKQDEEIWSIKNEIRNISNYLSRDTAPPADNHQTSEAGPPPFAPVNVQPVKANTPQPPEYSPFNYNLPPKVTMQMANDRSALEPTQAKKSETMESWFGRNVLGIAASILVFVGLVFLGTLVYKQFTETMKILAMYVISAIVTGLGITLMVKKRNSFTEILVGCGCGCFFISILLTHVYFDRISDVAAFSLLLVWLIAILFLSKILSSILLSIVAHIGMIVSICFAFGLGLTDEKLALLLIYQGVSIAVILLGNILCCKKTYNFSVFVSLLLTIVASCFMWHRFTENVYNAGSFPFSTTLPTTAIVIAFAAQFLCASFLSYLLSVSTNRLQDETYRMTVHVVNKALWLAALVMNVYHITYRVALGMEAVSISASTANQQLTAVFVAVLITVLVLLAHAAVTLLLSLKLNFNSNLETFSVLFLSVVASVFLIILWGYQFGITTEIPRISYLIILSLLLMLAKRISRNKTYAVGANAILAIDFLFMIFDGYRNLSNFGTIALSFGYICFYIGIIWAQYHLQSEEGKIKNNSLARLLSYVLVEVSLVSIILTSHIRYSMPILLLILTALNILLYLVRYDGNDNRYCTLKTTMFANELFLLTFDAVFIAFSYKNETSNILYLILSALALGLAFCRINKVFDGSDNNAAGILTGTKLTVLTLAIVYGHTSWFDQAYCFSIACMLIALTCIILGFMGRVKSLRLYGLVLTLVCVLKLVTYDVSNLNTPLRVVALIFGGVICFIISAIYNYTTKKIEIESVPKQ